MESESRIGIDIHGSSRSECCHKLAGNFMDRNDLKIAYRMFNLGIAENNQFEFLCGYREGVAVAFEAIISGAIHLQEIIKEYPDSEQAHEKGGPAAD